ncbi:cytochrome c oxidase assembly protein [Mycetocola zhadangensis]|uniref:cytochrome c oxidase assembly protein n=1 Tax=Mycetocola zhadangensis TaxID=1164595 RepID=UPI003A4D3DB2
MLAAVSLIAGVALVAMGVALAFGGGATAQPFEDPGPVVRWGIPVVKLVYNLCAAVTIGAFLFAAFVLPPATPNHTRSLRIALLASGGWTVASVLGLVFAFRSLVPMNLSDPRFFTQFAYFAQTIPLGQVWSVTVLLTASITLVAFIAQRPTHAATGGAFAVAALLPMSLTGHAAGDTGHSAAVTALALHMMGAAVWLGGLIVLIAIRRDTNDEGLKPIVQRYSTVALSGFIVVAISGVVVGVIQLNDVANLTSPYGLIVVAKVLSLILLGAAGAWNRQRLIRRLDRPGSRAARAFWLVVGSELILLAIVSGLAAALGRTSPPEQPLPSIFPSLAEAVTGNPTPPEPTFFTLFTQWRFDPLWALVCVAALVVYLVAVRRLCARGGRWHGARTVAWVVGLSVLFYATNGGIAVYQDYLIGFNVSLLLLVCLVTPLALLSGRPATLIRLIVAPREDGSTGVAESLAGLNRFLARRPLRNPWVWACVIPLSFAVFYFTPLVEWSLREPYGYHVTVAYFLTIGVLFSLTVLRTRTTGVALIAIGIFLVGMLGVALAFPANGTVRGAGWFLSLELGWRGGVLLDQRVASYLIAAVAVSWSGVLTAVALRQGHCDRPSIDTPAETPIHEGAK